MKKTKWGFAVLLVFCFIFSSSIMVSARPETVHIPYGEGETFSGYLSVPRFISDSASEEADEEKTTGSIEYFSSKKARTFALPAAYESQRRVNEAGVPYVLPPRNQGNDGTCWAFSACSAAETSMIKQNLFDKKIQLSPLQFVWFHYNRIQNPLKTGGLDRVLTSQSLLMAGGNEYLSVFALANWIGLIKEESVPYDSAFRVASNGLSDSLCFSEDAAYLRNALWISGENIQDVKELLMEHGSAMLPIYMDIAYYNAGTYGYCCNKSRYNEAADEFSSNHMVTVVGWNDAYRKENFKTEPKGDGAWLIKNSWGDKWGMDGYFWISYYDKSIYDEINGVPVGTTFTFLDMTSPDAWDNNYGHDGGGGINWYYFIDDFTGDSVSSAIMANVYTAQYEENLSAVSFYTIQEDVDYAVYVFCGVDTSISPTGGVPSSATVSGTLPMAGYHTIELPEEIGLTPGMKYTIAVELRCRNDKEAVRFMADGSSAWDWVTFSSEVREGESYYREPGKNWVDVAKDAQSDWYGNFRIRALTKLAHKEIPGDADANGKLTMNDAIETLNIAAKINTGYVWKKEVCDMDRDGSVTIQDALVILRKIAKIF